MATKIKNAIPKKDIVPPEKSSGGGGNSKSGVRQAHDITKTLVGKPTDLGSKKTFFAAFILAIVVVSWDEIKNQQRLPLPSRFLKVGMFFGILALAEPIISVELAAALAWGIVGVLIFNYYNGKSTKIDPPMNVRPIPIDISAVSSSLKKGSGSGNSGNSGNSFNSNSGSEGKA